MMNVQIQLKRYDVVWIFSFLYPVIYSNNLLANFLVKYGEFPV